MSRFCCTESREVCAANKYLEDYNDFQFVEARVKEKEKKESWCRGVTLRVRFRGNRRSCRLRETGGGLGGGASPPPNNTQTVV